ncbi:hypothetical protein [Streptomyces sp. NPDC001508]|uniref:alpha/beta fold hydrolase n=1 Tax=Streptomyces sp. NPDC001508 TaxID=3154656 RepID=UPI0033186BFC
MPVVRANACDFPYETVGSGEAIVFLHGETHSTRLFDDQLRYFGRSHRRIAYDRRGHARSEVPLYG